MHSANTGLGVKDADSKGNRKLNSHHFDNLPSEFDIHTRQIVRTAASSVASSAIGWPGAF
jgi:hypothetical protein